MRGGAVRYGVVQGGAGVRGGRGAHRRLSAALVARGAVRGRARLRRLRGGGARLRGDRVPLWETEVVRNGGFEDGGQWN